MYWRVLFFLMLQVACIVGARPGVMWYVNRWCSHWCVGVQSKGLKHWKSIFWSYPFSGKTVRFPQPSSLGKMETFCWLTLNILHLDNRWWTPGCIGVRKPVTCGEKEVVLRTDPNQKQILGQWPNFKLFGITIFSRENKPFKLLF